MSDSHGERFYQKPLFVVSCLVVAALTIGAVTTGLKAQGRGAVAHAFVHNPIGRAIERLVTEVYSRQSDPHPRQMWAINDETGKPELRPFHIGSYMHNLDRADLLPDEAYLAWMAGDLDWPMSEWEAVHAIGLVMEQRRFNLQHRGFASVATWGGLLVAVAVIVRVEMRTSRARSASQVTRAV